MRNPAFNNMHPQYRQIAFSGMCLLAVGLLCLFGILVLTPMQTTGVKPAFVVALLGGAVSLLSIGLPVFFMNLRLHAQGKPSYSLSKEGPKSRSRGYRFNQALALAYAGLGIALAMLALTIIFI